MRFLGSSISTSAVLIIIVGVVALFLAFSNSSVTGCTFELKICPNDRSVGRVGPNCEFAPCELPTRIDECEAESGFWKQWCYRDYAAEVALSPQLCDKINLARVKNSCYFEISNKADVLAVCDGLPNKFKDSCLVSVSQDSTSPNLCDGLSAQASEIKTGDCYRNVALNRLDETLCNKVTGLHYGSFNFGYLCLRGIALEKGDGDFCDRLESLGFGTTFYSDDCRSAMEARE